MMERLSDRAAEILNELHRERLDYGSEYIPLADAINKLTAYEDMGLTPEEVVSGCDFGCVFYSNRRCNLDGDWCAEGPGCPWELTPNEIEKFKALITAAKSKRAVYSPTGKSVFITPEEVLNA